MKCFHLLIYGNLQEAQKTNDQSTGKKMDSTIELIEALAIMNQSGLKPLLKSKRGGNNAGTYGHKANEI